MLTIRLPKGKPGLVDAYLCCDGLGTLALWLGKRREIHHIVDGLTKGAWEEKVPFLENWLECEINGGFAYSPEGHEITKADWPEPGKCVKIKLEMR